MTSEKIEGKLVLLGRKNVGKTCLVERYLRGTWKEDMSMTIGAAFAAKKVNLSDEESISLGIWDTAGEEKFESISRIYYRGAMAAIVCYDLTDKVSWKKVQFWVDELLSNEPECSIFIVGTKYDLIDEKTPRAVKEQEVKEFAEKINAEVFDTSAKTGVNVEELFNRIARVLYDKKRTGGFRNSETSASTIQPGGPQPFPQKRRCC